MFKGIRCVEEETFMKFAPVSAAPGCPQDVQSAGPNCRSECGWGGSGGCQAGVQAWPAEAPSPTLPEDSLPCGVKAMVNQRKSMEDFWCVVQAFMKLPLSVADTEEIVPGFVHCQQAYGKTRGLVDAQWGAAARHLQPSFPSGVIVLDTFHLFSVFDGHGGSHVSMHCANHLHSRLRDALTHTLRRSHPGMSALAANDQGAQGWSSLRRRGPCPEAHEHEGLSESDNDHDHQDAGDCAADEEMGESEEFLEGTSGGGMTAEGMAASMVAAFEEIDREVAEGGRAAYTGSTAVAALVGTWHICVAGCGDSRAVLFRAGTAIRVTHDHKPTDEDELARINSSGGEVLQINGCHRVQGILAMSRAIGDKNVWCVSASPEVTVMHRSSQDEFLLMGSDGLFDALDDQEACQLAKKCLLRAHSRGASPGAAAKVAASVLARAAIDRGSTDNITVLVVDLERQR
ncbi:unnamed protein product [Ostreobium quekettii]|uniref:protein-serine/threonine phosphatase n=1 Tax=Ostreobium quekettii TaxID=121088 RepID=A0A8S1IVV0_9CHLO|nr:unnamed protein product [Ostreobium quekettii]